MMNSDDIRVEIDRLGEAYKALVTNPVFIMGQREVSERVESCKDGCTKAAYSETQIRLLQGQLDGYSKVATLYEDAYRSRIASLSSQLGEKEINNARSKGYRVSGDSVSGGSPAL